MLLFSLHNVFKQSSYAFSAAVPVTDLDLILDALVDRVQWDNLLVLKELLKLLKIWNQS